MSGYVKIYSSILNSSVWSEPPATRCVWLTMLASCDADGKVETSFQGLCRAANVTPDECRLAVKALEAPDLDSKSPEWGGRRIEKVEGGWQILNYVKYRELRSPNQVATAERQARFRARQEAEDAERDVTEGNGDKRTTVDEAVAASVAVPGSSKKNEEERPGVAKLAAFLVAFDFGRWTDVVEGYIRSNRRPINVLKHLELHLTGEMGYKKREPVDVGFALNQYAASGQAEFVPVLFDGFVRRVKAQMDRNVGTKHREQEDARMAQERREREQREEDDRDWKMLTAFRQAKPERLAALTEQAEESVDRRYKGETRAVMVRDAVIRLVRKEAA